MRAKKGISQAYRDFGKTPPVPPFVIGAKQSDEDDEGIKSVLANLGP